MVAKVTTIFVTFLKATWDFKLELEIFKHQNIHKEENVTLTNPEIVIQIQNI